MTRYSVELVRGRLLSPSVRSLVFEMRGEPLEYRAGQAVNLLVPTPRGLVMRRPYSIASAPGVLGDNRFEVAVTRVPGGQTLSSMGC